MEGTYYFPNECDHLLVRWTQFNRFSNTKLKDATYSSILTAPGFVLENARDTIGSPKIINRYKFRYAELLLGRPIYCLKNLELGLEAGAQYAQIEFFETVNYTFAPAVVIVTNKSLCNCIGPEVNFNFS